MAEPLHNDQLALTLDEALGDSPVLDVEHGTGHQPAKDCQDQIEALGRCFREVEARARALAQAIRRDEDLPATLVHPIEREGEEARNLAALHVQQFTFEGDHPGSETSLLVGGIACSDDTWQAVSRLNEAKQDFRSVTADIRRALDPQHELCDPMRQLVGFVTGEGKPVATSEAGSVIRQMLNPRLSLLQTERSVVLLDRMPRRLRWRWLINTPTRRVTKQQALLMLENRLDQPFAQADVQRLHAIPEDEPLTLVRNASVRDMGCKINFPPDAQRRPSNEMKKTRIPVFYPEAGPYDCRQAPEIVMVPEDEPRKKRQRRIEPEPFLRSIPIHRYRPEIRDSQIERVRQAQEAAQA